jgi:hypothetical protein
MAASFRCSSVNGWNERNWWMMKIKPSDFPRSSDEHLHGQKNRELTKEPKRATINLDHMCHTTDQREMKEKGIFYNSYIQ